MSSDISRLRTASILEGLSYLILLVIAMPLKYIYDYPLAVRIVGMGQGILCVILILAIFKAHLNYKWSYRFSTQIFIASLIPLGAFWMDLKLKKIVIDPAERS